MDSQRVLLIGKRAGVLTRLAAALRARGIEADQLQDLTGAGVDPGAGYRAVAFGRAVKPADRERLRRAFTDADPDVVFVDGYAPITELLVAQFEQALDRRPLSRRAIVDASVRNSVVDLELRSPCRLRITSYRLDPLYRTHTRDLFDRQVEPGPHSAALDARAAKSRNAFIVIRADAETVALPAT